MKFEFVDELPESISRGPRVNPIDVKFAEALRESPGRWAKLPNSRLKVSSQQFFSTQINRGTGGPNPLYSGEFESKIRNNVVFVRYRNSVVPVEEAPVEIPKRRPRAPRKAAEPVVEVPKRRSRARKVES